MPAKKTATTKKTVAPKKKTASKQASVKRSKSSSVKTAVKKTTKTKPTVTAVPTGISPVAKLKKINPKQLLWPIILLIILGAAWLLKDQVIVAMVNGRPISRLALVKQLEQQGGSQVLESLITQALVEQALDEANIEVDQAQVDAQMQEIEDTITAQGQDLEELLAMQGLTREDVERDVRLNLQVDQLLADQIQVTDSEVEAYFESNKELLGEDADFETMKDQIRAQVEQEKKADAQQKWLEDIRNEAKIQYFKFEPQTSLY